jgi:hypothetical protein
MNIISTERSFRQLGDARFVFEVPDLGVVFDVDRLRRDRFGSLRGELTVTTDLAGARTVDGTLSSAEFNLSDLRARRELADVLRGRARTKDDDVDWHGLLEEFCLRVRDAERRGSPAVLLRDLPKPAPDAECDLDGVRLLKNHPVCIFGDGGGLKSYTALKLGGSLERLGVRVALIDWELSGEDHRDRLERLFGPRMPGIRYIRATRPLFHEADRIARIVADERLDYLIYDSVAFACDGPPEAAEVAANYFRAVRAIGPGSLHIAHITKGDKADQKPFGSTFWHNGFRDTWFSQEVSTSGDGSSLTLGLYNRKPNLGPVRPAVGFRVDFTETTTTFTRTNLADVEGLADKLTIFERVKHVLLKGARTITELATELDVKPDTTKKTIERWAKKGHVVRLPQPGGAARFAMAEHRRQEA